MDRRALIVSLRFRAGLLKEMEAYARGFASLGFAVKYLLHDQYKELAGRELADAMLGLREVSLFAPDLVIFYNIHPLNLALMHSLRRATAVVVLHEPFKPKGALTAREAMRAAFRESLQGLILGRAEVCVVLSPVGAARFMARYRGFSGRLVQSHITLLDQCSSSGERRWITYIGHVSPSTGFDDFVSVKRAMPALPLMLVTSDLRARQVARAAGLSVLEAEVPVKEHAIGRVLGESIAVVKLDRELTQSGVIPLAYMHGVPVIGRAVPGVVQDIQDGHNGIVLPRQFTSEQFVEAVDRVRRCFAQLAEGARKTYLARHSLTSWLSDFSWAAETA